MFGAVVDVWLRVDDAIYVTLTLERFNFFRNPSHSDNLSSASRFDSMAFCVLHEVESLSFFSRTFFLAKITNRLA